MRYTKSFALILAAAAFLAGCQSPDVARLQMTQAPVAMAVAPQVAHGTPSVTVKATPALAVQPDVLLNEVRSFDQSSDDFDVLAQQNTGYRVQGFFPLKTLFDHLKSSVQQQLIDRVKARFPRIQQRVKLEADVLKDARAAFDKAKWVDNGDGTATKTADFSMQASLNGASAEWHGSVSLTISKDTYVLVHGETQLEATGPRGTTGHASRVKTLQTDGSYVITVHRDVTVADGGSASADFSKTIAADGAASGSGKIVVRDAAGQVTRSIALLVSGNEENADTDLAPLPDASGTALS